MPSRGWRAVVRYSVAPEMRYVRGEWVDELRAVLDWFVPRFSRLPP
jgi:hypothetical protein